MNTGLNRVFLAGLAAALPLTLLACGPDKPLAPELDARSANGSGPSVNAPSSVTAAAVSFSQINVAWQDNSSNESGFEVHRSTTGPSGAFSLLATVAPNVTGYANPGLAAATQYCYKVRAFVTRAGKTGYSSFSNTACATTPAPPPPPPPAAPSGTDVFPASSSVISVGWIDNASNEDGFRVERSLDAGSSWTVAGTTASNQAALNDIGLVSEQQACYRVIAFNRGGDSPPSNTDCTTPPAGPTDLSITGVDSATGMLVLTWTDNSAVEDGYEVVGCFEDCSTWDVLPANATSDLIPCTDTHGFYVVALKDGGYSDQSYPLNPGCVSALMSSVAPRKSAAPPSFGGVRAQSTLRTHTQRRPTRQRAP